MLFLPLRLQAITGVCIGNKDYKHGYRDHGDQNINHTNLLPETQDDPYARQLLQQDAEVPP